MSKSPFLDGFLDASPRQLTAPTLALELRETIARWFSARQTPMQSSKVILFALADLAAEQITANPTQPTQEQRSTASSTTSFTAATPPIAAAWAAGLPQSSPARCGISKASRTAEGSDESYERDQSRRPCSSHAHRRGLDRRLCQRKSLGVVSCRRPASRARKIGARRSEEGAMKFACEIKAKAIELGFENIAIEHRGMHPMLHATIRGRPVQYFFAGTPSDRRSQKNNIADLRRIARRPTE